MTAANEIIDRAFREGNITPAGVAPTTDEIAEALPMLNGFLLSIFGHELGVKLMSVTLPLTNHHGHSHGHEHHGGFGHHHANEFANVRFFAKQDDALTVKLDRHPQDGAQVAFADVGMGGDLTLDAQDRLIEGAATVSLSPGSSAAHWFFRADMGNWVRIQPLVEADDLPFPPEFDDLFVVKLSRRLAPRYGKEPLSGTVETERRLTGILTARYSQTVAVGADNPFSDHHGSVAAGHHLMELS